MRTGIETTLDLGWELLAALPEAQLTRIDNKYQKYHPAIKERKSNMAIKDNIKPTRSELIELKKRSSLARRAQALKMKRDGSSLSFCDTEKAKDVRAEVEKQFAIARRNFQSRSLWKVL